jgi:hypothetical protein
VGINMSAVKLAFRLLTALVLLTAAGCGYDTSATFNADGSVTVGLKLLFPKDLMRGANGASISGFTSSDINSANSALQAKYPGAKIVSVTEGDESGASITIPFKTEKAAFDFMTAPPQLTPSGATSGTGVSLNLSNTGGMFTSATHTSAGGVDTYTFKTVPQSMPSPSPGSQQVISDSEIASIFTITFSLTVPHEITSAPGAVFTLDRKTATWRLNWTKAETLTATTGPDTGLAAAVAPVSDLRLAVVVGVLAIAIGIVLGMLMPWRRIRPLPAQAPAPVETPPET